MDGNNVEKPVESVRRCGFEMVKCSTRASATNLPWLLCSEGDAILLFALLESRNTKICASLKSYLLEVMENVNKERRNCGGATKFGI